MTGTPSDEGLRPSALLSRVARRVDRGNMGVIAIAMAVGLGVAVMPFLILLSSASSGTAWFAVWVVLLAVFLLPILFVSIHPLDPGCTNDCTGNGGYEAYFVWIVGGFGWLLGVLLGAAVKLVRRSESAAHR
jgi:hypothetical protein